MAFLELTHIKKSFGDIQVVHDFNMKIEKGEFVSFLGPSGCGKTTVLRMIAGFETPTAGTLMINGKDQRPLKPNQRNIGMVFQAYALFPNMTVHDNVAFGLKVAGMSKPDIDKRVKEMLALIKLDHLAARYPYQMSGGQQQRVALARAIAVKPQVLLLDEPLSALDAKIRISLREEIRAIQQQLGITTVFVTHDQEEALSISDRIVVMNGGRADQIGTPFEIYNTPATRFVASFVGSPAMNFLRGRIVRDGGPAFIAADVRFDLNGYAFRSLLSDAPAVLGIRPEHIEITGSDHPSAVTARVELVEPMGADALIWCRLTDGTAFSFRSDADIQARAGDTLALRFPAEAFSLFDDQSGQRL